MSKDEMIIFKFHDDGNYYGGTDHRTRSPLDATDFRGYKAKDMLSGFIGTKAEGEFIHVTFESTFSKANINDEGFLI